MWQYMTILKFTKLRSDSQDHALIGTFTTIPLRTVHAAFTAHGSPVGGFNIVVGSPAHKPRS